MKKTLFLSVLALISISARAEAAHNAAECPNLAGNYATQDGTQRMAISATKVPGGVTYSFGEGSNPVIADAGVHNLENGATYVATCNQGVVKTDVSLNGQVVLSFTHSQVNGKGDVRAISTGMEQSDIVWLKQ